MERRHAKYGCIGCATILLLIAVVATALFVFVMSLMRSSDAYTLGLERAKASPAVVSALGTPIEDGLLAAGSVNVTPASGTADLSIPLSGPKGEGTLYVHAIKRAGNWSFEELVLVMDDENRIDLLVAP